MEGSQSLVSITDTFTFTTSATTTTATSGPAVATVSPSVSFPVATPAQESVAGPSCSFSGGSFYSTQQRTHVPAKRAQVEPPQKTPKTTSKESCGKGGKNKGGGGRGVKNLLLWALSSPITIQMLGIPSLLSPLVENLVSTLGFKTSEIHLPTKPDEDTRVLTKPDEDTRPECQNIGS